jgi:ActR/RegA family two-component response regulator
MASSGLIKNPVTLYNLLRKDVREALDEQIILSEDLYFKDTLIIKAGSFLDDQTIYRLLNFGVKRVKILLPESKPGKTPFESLSILQLKKEYLKGQKCLIADRDINHINELIAVISASYIKDKNIIAVNNSMPVKGIIEEKQPKFIFVDLNLYPQHGLKIIKDIKKITAGNVFLTAMVDQSKTALVEKLQHEVEMNNATLLFKPVAVAQLRLLLLNSISNKEVSRYLSLKKLLSKKIKTA